MIVSRLTGVHNRRRSPSIVSRNDQSMQTLSTVDLSKSFKGRKVVDDINLSIEQGEVVGLLGPNGAGKTTTFYIIVGLAGPDSGQVLLNGLDITHFPMYIRARNGISYLPQADRGREHHGGARDIAAHLGPAARAAGRAARGAESAAGAAQLWIHAIRRRTAAGGNRPGAGDFTVV